MYQPQNRRLKAKKVQAAILSWFNLPPEAYMEAARDKFL